MRQILKNSTEKPIIGVEINLPSSFSPKFLCLFQIFYTLTYFFLIFHFNMRPTLPQDRRPGTSLPVRLRLYHCFCPYNCLSVRPGIHQLLFSISAPTLLCRYDRQIGSAGSTLHHGRVLFSLSRVGGSLHRLRLQRILVDNLLWSQCPCGSLPSGYRQGIHRSRHLG